MVSSAMAPTRTSPTETLERTRPLEIIASRPGRLMLRTTTDGEHHDLEVDGPLVSIGSHPSSTVAVDDASVSRMHCELEIKESGVMLRDCGSKNGTWIDDVRINEIWLPIGSSFSVGNSTIALRGIGAVDVPVSTKGHFGGLHGTGTAMGELFARLERIAAVELDVLCVGETGTGKELVARGIHDHSARRDGPFVVVDCTILNGGIAESILFGHCKGSFTDASRDQPGLLEQADGGTLFLDEIGELPVSLQPKLLRCLELRETRRVGEPGHGYRKFDARIVAATNRQLPRMMARGEFREDLYYRLASARIDIPPLRDRGEGNPSLLADLFLRRFSEDRGLELRLARGLYDLLERHLWRGNVRELHHAIRTAAMFSKTGVIGAEDLELVSIDPEDGGQGTSAGELAVDTVTQLFRMPWERARRAFGRLYANHLMTEKRGNQTRASRQAEMSRNAFRALMRSEDE